ncbi:hypothetical protein L1987_29304 [Smallanthus sonchifolius]|uniref:Uncharacterized protein n=1 Tax=Smallanthus sonchifolius TaxID=185202 RepID=A0ACB9I1E8_9ASTR|nr:hypothetical protein L1987_29304 [Smallanthus sonchifolius]
MAIASIWASMAAWFTPTVLFCATNLIIATIFITSNNNKNNKHHDHAHGDHSLTPISRVSSFLDRARSMNKHQYPSQSETPTYSSSSRLAQSIHSSSDYLTPPADELFPSEPETQSLSQPAPAPSLLQRVRSIKFSSDNSPGQLSFLDRVKSFRISSPFDSGSASTEPETIDNPEHHVIRSKSERASAKKKKSLAEMKKSRSEMRMAPSDEEDEDVDLRRPATARERRSHDVDEEVDARADDFISRFKQQLKLQRLESLVRYKEMLNRSS